MIRGEPKRIWRGGSMLRAAPRGSPQFSNAPCGPGTNFGNRRKSRVNIGLTASGEYLGRGVLLWLLGVPIPIIILIALLYH